MKFIFIILSPFWFFLSFFFPKSNKIWLYGAWFGQRYADNSKVFFEYCFNIDKTYDREHYWIYKKHTIQKEITAKGYKGVYAYSLFGIYLQLRAKVFVTTVNSSDFIPFLITPRNYFVQLWHGSPIKHIGINSRNSTLRKILDKIRFSTIDCYKLIISPSELLDNIYKEAFFSNQIKIFRCGYPRNEMLFIDQGIKGVVKEYFKISKTGKMILYLPTHRKEGKADNPFKEILLELMKSNESLKQSDITIIIKPHFYEKDSLNDIPSSSNIKIVYDFPFDLYNFLGACDGMITDYSSVMFDYELLNRPIYVYPFDFQKYTKFDRGLYFNFDFIYKTVANIIKVNSIEELVNSIIETDYDLKNKIKDRTLKFNVEVKEYSKRIRAKIIHDIEE